LIIARYIKLAQKDSQNLSAKTPEIRKGAEIKSIFITPEGWRDYYG
jgi:hypothetical protein